MKTTHTNTLVLAFLAAVALPLSHSADASPGLGSNRSPVSKLDVSHSEQGNFGLAGGGAAESGLDREFGVGGGSATFGLSGGECPADWDGDGALTSVDVSAYFNDYFTDINIGTLYADFNTDEITNSSDAVQYINAWFLGCW